MDRHIGVTLECFVKKGDKYLMLHRAKHKKIMPGVLMAPGGHVEFNEGLFAAARREVLEETGLEIKNLVIKAVGSAYMKDLDQELFFHLLVADYAGGTLQFSDHDGEMLWLTKEEILAFPSVLAELKEVLPYVLDGSEKVISFSVSYESGNNLSQFLLEKS